MSTLGSADCAKPGNSRRANTLCLGALICRCLLAGPARDSETRNSELAPRHFTLMSTPLVIDSAIQRSIADLREFAALQPVDMTKLPGRLATAEGKKAHMAQMTRQTISIPLAYLVTFSIEDGHPCGRSR